MKANHSNSPAGSAAGAVAAIEDQAADWLSRRDAGFTAAEKFEFQRWLAADDRHWAVFEQVALAWQTIRRPVELGCADAMMAELERRGRVRWWRRAVAAAASTGLAAAVLVFAFLPVAPKPTKIDGTVAASTVAVRAARQILPDGSTIELNAGAEVAEEYSPERRTVRLLRGTAHFSVEKDPARPFVVLAGTVAVRAVGTEFAVHLATRDVEVLVNEGRVAIEQGGRADAATSPMVIAEAGVGRRVTVPLAAETGNAPAQADLSPEEVARALAWRNQRVEFSGTPLREAIGLFNRENRRQLALGDEDLAGLRVSGAYWLNNPDGFARLVELSFGLRADFTRADAIVVTK